VGHPQIAAFARLASEKDPQPIRSIAGQNSEFTRTIHDMAYDPVRDEIVVPNFFAFAVLTFRGDANGDVAPVRKIFGPHTGMKLPQRLALDAVHGEIFVPQEDKVLVFNRDDQGDVAPKRTIEGPDTHLGASALTVDPVHNLLIVAGSEPRRAGPGGEGGGGFEGEGPGTGDNGHLLIFDRMASGNAKPLRSITGRDVTGAFLLTTIPSRGLIVTSVRKGGRSSDEGYVGVWSIFDNGNVPPRWTIGGPHGALRDVRGITIDTKHKTVIVSDKYVNGVLSYEVPEIF